jgi:hypothetical protein
VWQKRSGSFGLHMIVIIYAPVYHSYASQQPITLLWNITMHAHTAFALTLLVAAVTPASFGQQAEHPHDHVVDMATQTANPPATQLTDTRPIRVQFPAPLRDHTLANMRDHLSVLAEIQGYLATHHYDIAAEIAEQRLGMSSLNLHGAHEVAKYMPKGMQDAGAAMHHAASRFALTAQESDIDGDMGKSVAALATLTQTCVACHAMYRLR